MEMGLDYLIPKIFLDRDNDDITDSVNLQLHLYPSCSHPDVLSAVMDLSACLGFETMALNLSMAKENGKTDDSFGHRLHIGKDHELQGILSRKEKDEYFLKGKDEDSLVEAIRRFSFSLISKKSEIQREFVFKKDVKREGFDLLNPFSGEGFFCSSSTMPLPIFFPYKILIFSHLALGTAVEAVNFAGRLGLETLSLSLPLTVSLGKRPPEAKNFIYVGKRGDLNKIDLQGYGEILGSDWRAGIFLISSKKRIPDLLICGEEAGLKDLLTWLSRIPISSRGNEDSVFNSIKVFSEGLKRRILKEPLRREIPAKKLLKNYAISDEREEVLRILRERFKNKDLSPDSVEIQVFLMRPEKVRGRFKGKIKESLRRAGIKAKKMTITVLNSHKPGLSWMKEVVLRELSRRKVDRIEIAFKEFREKGLEEPIRWLQEVFPIDEIFAKGLSIPKQKVEFRKDSRIQGVYRVRAWQGSKLVYEKQFSPRWEKNPYLVPFPRSGNVYPCTGWVMMNINGEGVVNQRVKSGIERMWEIYQNEILPLIEREANKILLKRRPSSSQPIFEELRFDIYFNYPKEPLGVGEERISPLEALHEEIYFVTLDFFSKLLRSKRIKNLSLGRILPVVYPNFRGRGGRIRFTLVHRPKEFPLIPQRIEEVKVLLNGIVLNGSDVGIDLHIETKKRLANNDLRNRMRGLKEGPFRIKRILTENRSDKKRFRLVAFGSDFSMDQSSTKNEVRKAIEIPMDRPIGIRDGMKLIKSFGSMPGLKVAEEGKSFGGLPIFSIENIYPCAGGFVSHAKRIVFRPTLFINCRHHANEVSSTNAGLKLSYLLATRPGFQRLLKKVNVVINPMENVDGVAVLEEMLRLTPTDKLHAGRYNTAGQEYYREYFNPKTPFGEARVKPTLWKRWLPDICVDNHGFPSHEWEQPFSGYSPFRFREWWIPRGLFFFYLPYMDSKGGSLHRTNMKVLKDWIANAISKRKSIVAQNLAFSERYWKYRQRWFPKAPASTGDIQCLPLQRRFRRTNYSYRYPHITACDFITEVADEIAQGRFLRTCINAHLWTNLGILRMLNYSNFRAKKVFAFDREGSHFLWWRERPLTFKKGRKEGKERDFRF